MRRGEKPIDHRALCAPLEEAPPGERQQMIAFDDGKEWVHAGGTQAGQRDEEGNVMGGKKNM